MLSRTADHLYWMARFTERAENLARLLDVTHQMSLVPQSLAADNQNWGAILALNSLEKAFAESYDQANAENVLRFMVSDANNPSSIYSCLRSARENAHAVRGTLTAETWESCNATWIELREQKFSHILSAGVGEFFDWVKLRSAVTRGVTFGTMLQDEALHFIRLGGLIERSDNTARILDVKYHVLLPDTERVGGSLDYFQWTTILRSVSALTAYHWVYRQSLKPWLVADLLILNRQMPRSLAASYENMVRWLDEIGGAYGRQGSAQRKARATLAMLENTTIESVFQQGLHEFISAFVVDNNALSTAIAEQYLV
jgi:uncharacterized alpha-E superfamily protein